MKRIIQSNGLQIILALQMNIILTIFSKKEKANRQRFTGSSRYKAMSKIPVLVAYANLFHHCSQ